MKASKFTEAQIALVAQALRGLMPSEVKRLRQLEAVRDQVIATLLYIALGNHMKSCHCGLEDDSRETPAACLSRLQLAQHGSRPRSEPHHLKPLLLVRRDWSVGQGC
jgi:hypothetical protein